MKDKRYIRMNPEEMRISNGFNPFRERYFCYLQASKSLITNGFYIVWNNNFSCFSIVLFQYSTTNEEILLGTPKDVDDLAMNVVSVII